MRAALIDIERRRLICHHGPAPRNALQKRRHAVRDALIKMDANPTVAVLGPSVVVDAFYNGLLGAGKAHHQHQQQQ